MKLFDWYIILINTAAFAAMGVDKWRALNHRWRIRERRLFLLAVLGGSAGAFVGMWLFRHKTRHWYFVVGMTFILIAHILLGILIL